MNIFEFVICLFALALVGAVRHPFICLMAICFLVYVKKNK